MRRCSSSGTRSIKKTETASKDRKIWSRALIAQTKRNNFFTAGTSFVAARKSMAIPTAAQLFQFTQNPFAESANLAHAFPSFRINQPIGGIVGCHQREGLHQAAGGDIGGEEGRHQDGDALAGDRRGAEQR